MAPKTRTANYKDSVTAELILRAHFYIADTYSKDTIVLQLGKLIISQCNNPTGSLVFTGELQVAYHEACKQFAEMKLVNKEDMKNKDTDLESLLHSQTSSYWSGKRTWKLAQE
jgi:hypothetical protein